MTDRISRSRPRTTAPARGGAWWLGVGTTPVLCLALAGVVVFGHYRSAGVAIVAVGLPVLLFASAALRELIGNPRAVSYFAGMFVGSVVAVVISVAVFVVFWIMLVRALSGTPF
jgi:ABC-type Na+ efflux pump permease subunit